MEPSTWFVTASTRASQMICSFPGTSLVARARRKRPRPITTSIAAPVAQRVSKSMLKPKTFPSGWTPTVMFAASSRGMSRTLTTDRLRP
jgi:hypothetical protein